MAEEPGQAETPALSPAEGAPVATRSAFGETVAAATELAQRAAVVHVAPAPHVYSTTLTTRRMMIDVLIALVPVMVSAVFVFKWYAFKQVGVCILSCLAAEGVFTAMRGRKPTLWDCSAVVTGAILGLSLPWSAPWFVATIGSVIAIGIGKVVFGGVGQNIFNPAMVGRAFVMIAFPMSVGASGYVSPDRDFALNVVTQATPMTAAKQKQSPAPAPAAMGTTGPVHLASPPAQAATSLWTLFKGDHNGSLGEVSAMMCILGGLYLCLRRTASWEIPAGVLLAVLVIAGLANLAHPERSWTVLHHLLGGALLFGSFFIATDPVSSPLTPRGKFIFGAGVGALVMLIRVFSGYPEGVMFAVLLMNALVPLINRWTVPTPVGGRVPGPDKSLHDSRSEK